MYTFGKHVKNEFHKKLQKAFGPTPGKTLIGVRFTGLQQYRPSIWPNVKNSTAVRHNCQFQFAMHSKLRPS